jgi:hypothetical protein
VATHSEIDRDRKRHLHAASTTLLTLRIGVVDFIGQYSSFAYESARPYLLTSRAANQACGSLRNSLDARATTRRTSIMSFSTKHSAASLSNSAANSVARLRSAEHVDATANDHAQKSGFAIIGDPLFGMAIVSGMLFAMLAALIAFT